MNWHEPIVERGDFRVTPIDIIGAIVTVFCVVGGFFALILWG